LTQTGSIADDMALGQNAASPTADAPTSRRERRQAELVAARTANVRRRRNPGPVRRGDVAPADSSRAANAVLTRSVAPASSPKRSSTFRRRVLPAVVITITAGMFGTVALPAIAAGHQDGATVAGAGVTNVVKSQSLTVSDVDALADTSRDGYSATSTQTLASEKAAATAATAAAAAKVSAARATTTASYSYSGETAADYVANPKYPTFSLAQVASVAQQYIGTPYVFGGATPAGFDCSGFVMYVYAQFGISLQHSVPLEDAAGTTIPVSEAQPGDVVVFDNEAHDGFYMGNGMILDAPKPGGFVSIRKIWDQPYHIVRFGIK
jgi:cell wall-associated NlpC family hydrolase